ncbi:MAG: recombinase family protein [Lachnospiraceae bacterium]|nr:recombinase family protein [Ruminococcus sp.]MCM1276436.1 recombinase family protein [Lachnospiraceae bacterium]
MPQTNKKITALYCRLSKEDLRLGESESIQNQKLILERFAKENHLPNIRFFVDDGISGVKFKQRDGLQEMLDEVEAGNVATVITKDLSRLGRNYLKTGELVEITFPENGVRYIAIADGVDTAREDNEFMPLRNWFNEFYARDTSKKIRAVKFEKARRGERSNGERPYGYLIDPENHNHLIVDKDAAPIVKKIFEMYVGGARMRDIQDWLRENKVPTPTEHRYRDLGKGYHPRPCPESSCNWSTKALACILTRREYIGTTVTNKSTKLSYKSDRVKMNDDSERFFFPNTHEPIVDEETFELAQKRYATRTRPKKNNEIDLFAGLVYCADCGKKMYVLHGSQKKRVTSYSCGNYRDRNRVAQRVICTMHYVRQEVLIELVLKDIRRVLRFVNDRERAFIAAVNQSDKKQAKAELAAEKRELKAAETRLDELNTLFRKSYEDNALGKISDEQFSFLTCGFDEEKAELEKRSDELRKSFKQSAERKSDVKKFVLLAKKYVDLSELNYENVHALIDKILVHELDESKGTREIEILYSGVGKIYSGEPPVEVSFFVKRRNGYLRLIVG